MTPEDFSQFDDPRVREVMAAAANLVEETITVLGEYEADRKLYNGEQVLKNLAETLAKALFAAQHSKPRKYMHCNCPHGYSYGCPNCPKDQMMIVLEEKNPPQVEAVLDTCLGGCECPRCGENAYHPLKRCTKCHGDGLTHCEYCEARK